MLNEIADALEELEERLAAQLEKSKRTMEIAARKQQEIKGGRHE